MLADDGTMTIDEAAAACGVSDETIRRRLRADRLPGSYRSGRSGAWRIPIAALTAAGFHLRLDTRVIDDERQGLSTALAVAEAVAAERLQRIEMLERHLADLRAVLRRLEVEL